MLRGRHEETLFEDLDIRVLLKPLRASKVKQKDLACARAGSTKVNIEYEIDRSRQKRPDPSPTMLISHDLRRGNTCADI